MIDQLGNMFQSLVVRGKKDFEYGLRRFYRLCREYLWYNLRFWDRNARLLLARLQIEPSWLLKVIFRVNVHTICIFK